MCPTWSTDPLRLHAWVDGLEREQVDTPSVRQQLLAVFRSDAVPEATRWRAAAKLPVDVLLATVNEKQWHFLWGNRQRIFDTNLPAFLDRVRTHTNEFLRGGMLECALQNTEVDHSLVLQAFFRERAEQDPSAFVRRRAVTGLRADLPANRATLTRRLRGDGDAWTRQEALEKLAGSPAGLLLDAASDADPAVRRRAFALIASPCWLRPQPASPLPQPPTTARTVAEQLGQMGLSRIELRRGGQTESSFSDVLMRVLARRAGREKLTAARRSAFSVETERAAEAARSHYDIQVPRVAPTRTWDSLLSAYGNDYSWKAVGRTLQLTWPNGRRLNVKVEKRHEREVRQTDGRDALRDEMLMDITVGALKPKLRLRSEIPVAKELANVVDMPEKMLTAVRAVTDGTGGPNGQPDLTATASDGERRVLVYEPPPHYHRYLNDETLSSQQFLTALATCMYDAGTLFRRGWHNVAPADLMHGNKVYVWCHQTLNYLGWGSGAGSLKTWRRGVAFPNQRATGNGDFKHYKTLGPAIAGRDTHVPIMFDRPEALGRLLGHALIMGDTLLATALVCADSWLAREQARRHHAGASGSVNRLNLQQALSTTFVTFLAAYGGYREREARAQLAEAGVDFKRMAEQIQYFCGDAYVHDIDRFGDIPAATKRALFGAAVVDTNHITHGESWTPAEGWCRTDGKTVEPNLGPPSGPMPLTELIRAIHVTVGLCATVG